MIPRLACRNERGFIAPRLLGLLLIAAGVLLNRWTLGHILAFDCQINGEWRNAQIAGVRIFLGLSGVVLTLPGLRDWSAASRWRLGAVALAVPALSGTPMLAGFGTYIYLTQHQHTINSSNLGAATPAQLRGAMTYAAATGKWHFAIAGSTSSRPNATASKRNGATASTSSIAPTCLTTKC